MGLILDIVPNHMATDDANRYWSDPELRERFFDIDPETGRHRRFFDIDHLAAVRQEDPAVFEETHSLALALVRTAPSTACGSTTRTGSPTRPATCGGCATAARATSGSRRSSTPARSCATGPSTARSATSSSTTSRRCSSTRRARRR